MLKEYLVPRQLAVRGIGPAADLHLDLSFYDRLSLAARTSQSLDPLMA